MLLLRTGAVGNAQSGIRVFLAPTACAGRSIWKPQMQAHDLLQELPTQPREATVPHSLPVSQTSCLHGCQGALWVGVREPGSDPTPALHEPHRHSLNFHFLRPSPGSKLPLPAWQVSGGSAPETDCPELPRATEVSSLLPLLPGF